MAKSDDIRNDRVWKEPLPVEIIDDWVKHAKSKFQAQYPYHHVLVLHTVSEKYRHNNRIGGKIFLETLGPRGELKYSNIANFKLIEDAKSTFKKYILEKTKFMVYKDENLLGSRMEAVI